MDLSRRIEAAARATDALREALAHDASATEWRDAAILRFVLAFEATWKAARAFLLEVHGLDEASPKAVARASLRVGLLGEGDGEAALEAAQDRNLVVHTYDQALARALAGRLPGHLGVLERWLEAMRAG